jgi:hypothetical protein
MVTTPWVLVLTVALMGGAQGGAKKGRKPAPAPADDMNAAMEKAQKDAHRPGDDALGCDALQEQMVAYSNDPAVRSVMTRQGLWGQDQMDKLNGAGSGRSKASVAAQAAMGFASAFIPGLGGVSMAAQAAQAQGQAAQAEQNQAQMMARMQDMLTILPQMMRGQRVMELAQARKCDWLPQQQPQK